MSIVKNPFDDESFLSSLRKQIEQELVKTMEPAIQNAVTEIEKSIRARLGQIVISLLDTQYDVMMDRRELRITVRKVP